MSFTLKEIERIGAHLDAQITNIDQQMKVHAKHNEWLGVRRCARSLDSLEDLSDRCVFEYAALADQETPVKPAKP